MVAISPAIFWKISVFRRSGMSSASVRVPERWPLLPFEAKVPEPARRCTSPSASSVRRARATVGRDAPNFFTNCDSLGIRPPALYLPVMIASRNHWEISVCLWPGAPGVSDWFTLKHSGRT